jgi:hypothetical protein
MIPRMLAFLGPEDGDIIATIVETDPADAARLRALWVRCRPGGDLHEQASQ